MPNQAPTNLTLNNSTVAENKAVDTVVGNLTTTDPDTGDTFTYSLVTGDGATDNSLFTITGNQLKTNSVFDFESKNSYRIRVKTTDQGGLSFEKQLTIGVTLTPELVGKYNTSSANGVEVVDNYAYVADGDKGLKIIDISNRTNLTLKGTYDTSGDALGVQVVGNYAYVADGNSGLQIVDISDPTTPTRKGTYDTDGYALGVQVVGNYAYVADGNSGLQIVDITDRANPTRKGTYDTDGNAFGVQVVGNDAYVADGSSGLQIVDITDRANPRFKGNYDTDGNARNVQVVGKYYYLADSDGGLQITTLYNRPTNLTLSTSTVAENQVIGTVVGNLITTDPDTGDTFTYSLVTGDGATDNSLFTITNNQLKTNAVFNFETKNSYSIRVKTTDLDKLSFERQLTIGVNNVNETPTNLTLSNNTVAENQVSGTVVGNLTTTDPDTGNTFTYSLVSGTGATDNSLFTIVDNQLQTNSVFNFESKNSYRIRVKTTDLDKLSFERQLTIGVSNVNEAPVIISAATATFAENGTETVYTVTATDADANTTLTYSLSGADANLFNINNRAITFKTAPNFEAPSDNGTNNVYNIDVIANDGALTATKAVAITVTNVNEPPTLDRPSSGNPFVIKGDNNDKKRLEVKLTGYSSKLNSELGVFTVDDADGKIDGIAPGAPGYTDKALQRGQVIFSLLGNSPVGFDQSRLSRLLEFNSNSNLRFYLVKDGSTDSVLNNTTPKTNVLFDISSNVRTTTLGNGFSLAWEDGSGNANGFEDLRVTITPTDTPVAPGTTVQNNRQGVKGEKELLDLRGINGPVKADFVVNREAAYNNFVGFYKVNDENGGIDTDGNGTIDVRPGATGYAQAALKARVSGLDLTVNNNGTASFNNKTLQGGSFFAPFIITNGGIPDNYDNINSRIYFTFGAANSDGVDHVRLLGDNTFGFEDLAGGGDKDFNDVIVKVNLPV